jgi:SAM-dependent methyltransferase
MLYEDIGAPEPVPVFGMYPRGLITKLLPWMRCRREEVLHVCSGALPHGEGIRIDIRRTARPDIIADGRALPLRAASVVAVMIDPPYTEHYAAELYGTDYPRPSHLLREAARVVRPGGRIVILHFITPNPPKGARLLKVLGLSTGYGYPIRAVTIFERDQEHLPGFGADAETPVGADAMRPWPRVRRVKRPARVEVRG